MFAALAKLMYRRKTWVLAFFAVLILISSYFGQDALNKLKPGGFEDGSAESWQVRDLLEKEMNVGGADIVAIYSFKSGTIDDIEAMTGVLSAIDRYEKDPSVLSVNSFYTTGAAPLVSKDRTRTFVLVSLRGSDEERVNAFDRLRESFKVEGADVAFAGIIPFNKELNETIDADLKRAELLAFPITATLLFFIFGSVASAALPLIVGGCAIALALALLRLMTTFMDVSIFAANIVTILGLGLSIDYSLFLLNRYREEKQKMSAEDALLKSMSTTGRAVAFSGITVAASMLGLFAFPQMFFRSLGLGGVVVVLGAVLLSLTLLPALLAMLGDKIDWGTIPVLSKPSDTARVEKFWHGIAYSVTKRPLLVAVAVVIPLVALAIPFGRFDGAIPNYKILPSRSELYQANALLEREFLAFQTIPHQVVATVEGSALGQEQLRALYDLPEKLAVLPDVARVDSLFSVIPHDKADKEKIITMLAKPKNEQDPTLQLAIDHYVKDGHMRFDVIPNRTFTSQETLHQVDLLRETPKDIVSKTVGVELRVGGLTALLIDFKKSIADNSPTMVIFVYVVMFIVLFFVFGSVTLPIKAMLMNSLSLTASFGAIVYIFQDGRLTTLLDYTPLGFSDLTQPLIMFAAVFGMSMDYEVLLLSRVQEEYLRTGDNTASVAYGLSKTGRLITSASLLLGVVIAAFATSDIVFMKSLGVGMFLAIVLDATVIRALLVPAAMDLMGKWNWYAPAPLVALWKKVGLGDLEGHG